MRLLLAAFTALMVAAMPVQAQAPRIQGEWLFPGQGGAEGAAALSGGGVALTGPGRNGPRLLVLDDAMRVADDWTIPGSDAVPAALAAPPGALTLVAGPADPVGHEHGIAVWRMQIGADGRLKQDWLRRFRRTSLDGVRNVTAMDDGGVVVTGWTGGREGPNEGAWILRLGADGETIWRRIAAPVVANGRFDAGAATPLPGDGVLIAAHGAPGSGDPGGVWLLRLDANGEDRSQHVIDELPDEHPEAVTLLPDGAVAVAGWTLDVDQGRLAPPERSHAWLARVQGGGRLAWTHSWPDAPGRLHAILPLADSGVVVAGEVGGEGLLARLDPAGSVIWERRLGARNARLTALTRLPDGAIVAAGENKGRMWAVKLTE